MNKAVYMPREELRKAIEADPKRIVKISVIADRVNVRIDTLGTTSYFCSMETAEGRLEKEWLLKTAVDGGATFVLFDKPGRVKVYYEAGLEKSRVALRLAEDDRAAALAKKEDIFAGQAPGDRPGTHPQGPGKRWSCAGIDVPVNARQHPDHIKAYIPADNGYVCDDSVARRAVACIMHGQPLLLEGHTGVGKTEFVKWLAHKTNNPLLVLQGSEDMESSAVLGHLEVDEAGTYFVDGLLTVAVKKGFWLYFDEVNAVPAGVKIALHGLLDDSRFLVLADHEGERVDAHPNFRMIAACNPADHGAYLGAGQENLAFLNRFAKVHMDYMEASKERRLLRQLFPRVDRGVVENLVRAAELVRGRFKDGKLMGVITTRDLKGVCQNLALLSVDEALSVALSKFSRDDGKMALDAAEQMFGKLEVCRAAVNR